MAINNTLDIGLNLEAFEDFVSVRDKGIPNGGSRTQPTRLLDLVKVNDNIINTVRHDNGDVTIKTKFGYVRFWKKK